MRHLDRNQIRISGIIIPSGWGEKGNIITISIMTFDEDEYFIDKDETGGQLLSLIHKVIEVRGIVREEDGNKIIRIKRYRLNDA